MFGPVPSASYMLTLLSQKSALQLLLVCYEQSLHCFPLEVVYSNI